MSPRPRPRPSASYERLRERLWANGAIADKSMAGADFDWSPTDHSTVPTLSGAGREKFSASAGFGLSGQGERFLADAAHAHLGVTRDVHYRIRKRRIEILDPNTKQVIYDPDVVTSTRWAGLVQALETKHLKLKDKTTIHAYHAAFDIHVGMHKADVRGFLGDPPGGVSTGRDVIYSSPVVGAFHEPSSALLGEEYWLYRNTPPGGDTQIVVSSHGLVTQVEIKPVTG